MPKIRNIKPEFWTDEKIVELSAFARLFFIGMWNFADDNGILERNPKQLKMRIFPNDKVDIDKLLEEIEHEKLAIHYQVDGKSYLWIVNFAKHQYISEAKKTSTFPLPPEEILDIPRKTQEIPLGIGIGIGSGKKESSGSPSAIHPSHIGQLWNEIADPVFPRIIPPINGNRLKLLKTALKDHSDLDWWRHLFKKANSIPFLKGENDREWKADFDFVLKKYLVILEGKYDRAKKEMPRWKKLASQDS